ncbi:Glycerol-3-phosphate ABC transporter, permease protein UgpA [Pseudomonas synxantha]|nr:Glycerol-3-phosphate ABC transporter, permease protein UgpA [Pseudomonas synxantha]
MLAKIVNDNAGCLIFRGARAFFASKLAPTKRQRVFSIYQ